MSRKASVSRSGSKAEKSVASSIWEQVSTLVLAVVIALGIRALVIEPYRIPSESMIPTLLVGDHLFVNKFIYGAKLPFTELRAPALRAPARGDVVVFTVAKQGGETYPADLRSDLPREEFVKRIVGIPGDRIEIRNDLLYVNGEAVPSRPLPDSFADRHGRELHENEVTLDAHTFVTLNDPYSKAPPFGPILVGEGRYFMLGDNRDYSKDSRFWGTVRLAEIKGPAFLLYWSWNFNGSWAELLNPLTWVRLLTGEMRWDRMGDGVP